MEKNKVYVKSAQPGIIAQHMNPSFKYVFEDEPIEMKMAHAEFLVEDNVFMFSIVKDYKPKKVQGFDVDKASKDELLDYTAKHNIEADYSMTKSELIKLIKEEQ